MILESEPTEPEFTELEKNRPSTAAFITQAAAGSKAQMANLPVHVADSDPERNCAENCTEPIKARPPRPRAHFLGTELRHQRATGGKMPVILWGFPLSYSA